jgi:hypothetical protein
MATLPTTADLTKADLAMLARMHAPAVGHGEHHKRTRKPYTWFDWLQKARLVDDGYTTGRGVVSRATDGHLCRSLFERHIDDFLNMAGIGHDTEPMWPAHADHNATGGLRAVGVPWSGGVWG